MTKRVLAGAAAGWVSLHLLLYVWIIRTQGGDVAGWYLVLAILASLACLAASAGLAPAATTTTALVLTALATFAGLLSIGLLLVPADVALAAAVVSRSGPSRRLARSSPTTRWAAEREGSDPRGQS